MASPGKLGAKPVGGGYRVCDLALLNPNQPSFHQQRIGTHPYALSGPSLRVATWSEGKREGEHWWDAGRSTVYGFSSSNVGAAPGVAF